MQHRTPLATPFARAGVTAVVTLGLLLPALPAAAASAPVPAPATTGSTLDAAGVPTPGDPTTGGTPADAAVDLTVVLTPTDPTALRDLPAQTAGSSTTDRAEVLSDVAPAPDGRATTRAALEGAGFVVTESGTWELEATGTAAQAEALLGVALVGSGDGMHPTTEPVMPASFGGAVTAVLGLDTRPVASHAVLPGGYAPADLARAYASNAASNAGAGATVATVQFSGWNRNDLTTYARAAGRPVPALEEVPVDGASTRTADGFGGEVEVALDQQMLLATAPAARQRVYIAPNEGAGMYDAYSDIADDVQSHGITAVSISWGSCEALMSSGQRAVFEDALDRIVTAGATVFAASGDDGSQCPIDALHTITSVSFPASSPAVVGVGGTSLRAVGSSWTESAWGDRTTGASGGGVSAFPKPAWQTGTGVTGTQRLVPDIASIADPNRGAAIFSRNGGGYLLGGGTSLASPVVAGQLAATLSARGCTIGVGDLHPTFYANPQAFRDVTTGSNLTAAATRGHDQATGLGSPNWAALAPLLPTAAGCATAPKPVAADPLRFRASGTAFPTGAAVHSPSGQYWLALEGDGRLVAWGNNRVLWSTPTSPGASLRVQTDGNVVVARPDGSAVWSTRTSGRGSGAVLQITDSGDVQVVRGGALLWHDSAAGTDRVAMGGWLAPGQTLWDAQHRTHVTMRDDGVLVLTGTAGTTWHSPAGGRGAYARMGGNGDFTLLSPAGKVVWRTGTGRFGGSGMELVMRTDGRLALVQKGAIRWSVR